jgi:hypothetical protein
MNTELNIRKFVSANDTELRSLEFDINSSKIITPVKSLNAGDFYKETVFPKDLTSIGEVFFKFDDISLKLMAEDKNYNKKKNEKARKNRSKLYNCSQMCITQFNNKNDPDRYPTESEVDTLINTAYSFSDITPIPSIPKVARNINLDNFNEFLGYLQQCYEKIMIHNKKKILGYIPVLAPLFMNKLIDFYIGLDTGINAFYIDFDGTMITSHLPSIDAIKRRLAFQGYEENNFIHFINVNYGKAINDQEVLSARDLLAFGNGLDSLGGNHSGPRRNPDFYKWLKENKDVVNNSRRLLSIEDYGYYRWNSLGEKVDEIYPKDALVPISTTKSAQASRLDRTIKIVNMQQQSKEAIRLRTLANEQQENTLGYFKTKKNVKREDLKALGKRKA